MALTRSLVLKNLLMQKFIEPSQMSQQPEEDILSNDGSEALKNF